MKIGHQWGGVMMVLGFAEQTYREMWGLWAEGEKLSNHKTEKTSVPPNREPIF